jgi:hypothetical protein
VLVVPVRVERQFLVVIATVWMPPTWRQRPRFVRERILPVREQAAIVEFIAVALKPMAIVLAKFKVGKH